jgi:hypothetical protein
MAELRLKPIDVVANKNIINVEVFDKPIPLNTKPTVLPKDSFQNKVSAEFFGAPVKKQVKYTKDPLNFALNVASNFIPSSINVAKGYVEPILSPVETYNNIKSVFNGFAELKAYNDFIKENPSSPKPPITQDMQAAQGVSEYFAERYGDVIGPEKDAWSVVGDKILRTLENDPAGLMADVGSVLTLGTTGVTGVAGKTGQIAKQVRNVGESIDPVIGTIRASKKFIADPLINIASGKGTSGLINNAYDISKASARGAEALKQGLQGKVTSNEILADFNKKVSQYKTNIQNDFNVYEKGLKGKTASFESLDKVKTDLDSMFDDLYFTKTENVKGHSVQVTRPKPATPKFKLDEYNDIKQIVNDFDNLDTVKADDILRLKKDLSNRRFSVPTDSVHPLNDKLKTFNQYLEDDLSKVDPRTPNVMKQYNKMKYDLDEIRKTVGKPNNLQPQISKLQQLVKDTPRGEVGLKNINQILQELETQAIPQLTGLSLGDPLRASVGGLAGVSGGLLFTGASGLEKFAYLDPSLGLLAAGGVGLASSPRLLGQLSSGLGSAARYGVDLQNIGNIGRYGRPIQQTGLAPFPVTDEDLINFKIDPSLFPR